MAESNATQVILTDDGIKIINAQNTADNAAGGVANLNDPNLMSVIEKQTQATQYAGLTSQYNVILKRAKDANVSTTALTTAYTNLNTFMTVILTNTTKASDVDRATYKKYQDAYNTALSNVQAALKDAYNTDISNMQSSVAVASQAASSAVIVASQAATTGDNASYVAAQASTAASQAQSAGDNATSVANNATSIANNARSAADSTYAYANSEMAVQSNATAKAQSAADNAFSQAQAVGSQADSEIAVNSMATTKAQSAADNAFSQAQAVGSQVSAEISSNSTATAKAQSTADNAFSQATTAINTGNVASQAVTALKDGSTMTIAQLQNGLATKVANSDYASYKDQTASQIGEMVTNGAFSAYQQTTADLISSKVANSDFSAYQATTAKAIESKVESKDFNTYKTQTADLIDDKVSNSAYASDKTQTASQIANMVSNSAFSTYQNQTASQIAQMVTNGAFSAYKQTTANLISAKVANSDFSAYQATTAKAIESKVESKDFNTYKTQTADAISSKVESKNFQALQTQVNNSSVGTNLVSDSGPEFSGKTYIFQNYSLASLTALTPGETYTMSFSAKVDTKAVNCNQFVFVCVINPSWGWESAWAKVPISTDYQRVTLTFTVPEGVTDANRISAFLENPTINGKYDTSAGQNGTAGTGYIKELKLEKGSVATDFSLNPADTATQSQITQLSGEIEQKVSNSEYASYKDQTASQIGEMVTNGAFSAYKQTTANLISSKVATSDFSSYKDQTATAIGSKVESKDFKSYQEQTDKAFLSKVESSDFQTLQTQVNNSSVGTNLLTGTSNIQDCTLSGAGWRSATQSSNGKNISIPGTPGKSYTYSAIVKTATFVCYPEIEFYDSNKKWIANSFPAPKTDIGMRKVTASAPANTAFVGASIVLQNPSDSQTVVFNSEKLEKGSIATDWSLNPEDQATQSQITQLSDKIDLRVTKGDLVDQINVQAGKTLISSSGQLILSGNSVVLDSVDPVIMTSANIGKLAVGTAQIANAAITDAQVGNVSATKLTAGTIDFNKITGKNINASNITTGKLSTDRLNVDKLSAVSADLGNVTAGSLKGVDIVANSFSTPNGSFTTASNGSITAKNMTLIGGTLTSPTINTSTINGSTINGTTFNGGSRINNSNNTAGYYPMTITPDGTYKSTYFDNAVGLQSSVESGAIEYKYRSMIGNGQYMSYNSVIDGQGFHSQSGYTSAKDSTFSSPQTITGYVDVTPATGIYLYGPTQQINFAGRSDNIGSDGITMDAYGNIYAQYNSSWWRIGDVNGNQIINFGIDKAGSNHTEFKRDIYVGNIGINTAHSIISKDGNGLYINSGKGGRANLNVASLNYTGSVSKSLLSEKKDVKKVDTAYWAQLVNSIDLATYQYKDDDNTSNLRLSGIVDDVNDTKQWQLPDVFVARDEDGKLAGIENIVLQNAMLATIQEQQKEIDKLNGHLLKLEAKLNG